MMKPHIGGENGPRSPQEQRRDDGGQERTSFNQALAAMEARGQETGGVEVDPQLQGAVERATSVVALMDQAGHDFSQDDGVARVRTRAVQMTGSATLRAAA